MKSLITVLLASCVLTSTTLHAQDYEIIEPVSSNSKIDVKKLKFGIFFAPTISWMKPTASKSDDGTYMVESLGSKMGYTWGLMIDYFFTENYGLYTGSQINTSGGKILASYPAHLLPGPNTVYKADFNYTVQYLEFPFNFKFKTDEIGKTDYKAFAQLGLTAGFNIGKRANYTVHYTDEHTNMKTATGSRERLAGGLTMAPMMLQLNVGAGLERPITDKLVAYAGIFFNNGLLPDATNPKEFKLGYNGTFGDGKVRLNNFALKLGIFF